MEFSENDIISEIPPGDPGPSSSSAKRISTHDLYKQTPTSMVEETIPPKSGNEVAGSSNHPETE